MILAVATFAAVRFGSQPARFTERALLAGLLPILVPSRLHDRAEKIRFADDPCDKSDRAFLAAADAITARQPLTVDLLYGDHEGGKRTISRFILTPRGDTEWLSTVSRHWRLDGGESR